MQKDGLGERLGQGRVLVGRVNSAEPRSSPFFSLSLLVSDFSSFTFYKQEPSRKEKEKRERKKR